MPLARLISTKGEFSILQRTQDSNKNINSRELNVSESRAALIKSPSSPLLFNRHRIKYTGTKRLYYPLQTRRKLENHMRVILLPIKLLRIIQRKFIEVKLSKSEPRPKK